MLTIDTNILLYKSGAEHPLKAPCTRVLDLVADGTFEAMTTPEAIQEFAHVYARRRGRQAAVERAIEYAALLAPLRSSELEHLEVGLQLWADNEQLDAFDSVLAAVALDTKYSTVVSADRAFASVPGITHVFPDDDGIASLLTKVGR